MQEKIIEIMAKVLEVDASELDEDTAIGDIPTWDSLRHIGIISAIEKEFDIQFTPDILLELEDVCDIVQATEDRIGK